MGSSNVNVSSTRPRRLANASALRMFMPKLESVPATEANRNGRSAATSVSCQADSSRRMSTAAAALPALFFERHVLVDFLLSVGPQVARGKAFQECDALGRAGGDGFDALRFQLASQLVVDRQVELPQLLGAPRRHDARD